MGTAHFVRVKDLAGLFGLAKRSFLVVSLDPRPWTCALKMGVGAGVGGLGGLGGLGGWVGWLSGWLVGWLVGWWVGRSVGRSVGWVA